MAKIYRNRVRTCPGPAGSDPSMMETGESVPDKPGNSDRLMIVVAP